MGHSVGDWSAHRVHIDLVVDHRNTLATHAVGHGEALLGLNDSLGATWWATAGASGVAWVKQVARMMAKRAAMTTLHMMVPHCNPPHTKGGSWWQL